MNDEELTAELRAQLDILKEAQKAAYNNGDFETVIRLSERITAIAAIIHEI